VYAAANFVLNVLFARWLSPLEFGLFAVSFSGYLLLMVIHYGAILEPLLVQSAQVPHSQRHSYVTTLSLAHALCIGIITVISLAAYVVLQSLGLHDTGLAFVGAGIGGSLMATLLTYRRLCLVFLTPRASTMVGILYFLGVSGSGFLLFSVGRASWFDAWVLTGGWSLVGSVFILALLYTGTQGNEPYSLAELLRFQLRYARYGIVASLCSWLRVDGVIIALSQITGLTAVAETRAMLNLVLPLNNANAILGTSWVIEFSEDHKSRRPSRVWNKVFLYTAFALSLVMFTWQLGPHVAELAYGARFAGAEWILPWFVFSFSATTAESIFSSSLKARGVLVWGYASQIVGAFVALGTGLVMISEFGESGAVAAIFISAVSGLLVGLFGYVRS
jgi:O-antigen/teichoic acid export membrane protein